MARILQEQLARLRGSWSHESHRLQQQYPANFRRENSRRLGADDFPATKPVTPPKTHGKSSPRPAPPALNRQAG
eukprot:scaffold80688_cov54-Phaeocystis_antarctica.AAC.3